jgi:hypothetical protein
VNEEKDADDIQVEDSAEDAVKFVKKERVGHGEDADDPGTRVAENGSKNRSLEWGGYTHSSRLPAAMPPDPRVPGALL